MLYLLANMFLANTALPRESDVMNPLQVIGEKHLHLQKILWSKMVQKINRGIKILLFIMFFLKKIYAFRDKEELRLSCNLIL